MFANKEKMKGIIYKMEKKGRARLSRLKKIKEEFYSRFNSLKENTPFKLNFEKYKNIGEDKKVMFSTIFSLGGKTSFKANVKI